MAEWLTTKQMCDRFNMSRATLQRRTRELEQSPYKDAVVHEGRNYYFPERFKQFIEYRSKKRVEAMYGLQLVRDRSVI